MAHADAHAAEYDAHGHKDHGHVIVNIWTLRTVLGALLFFTLATVAAAWIEEWVSLAFNVVIPQWINVFVALSIAVVKTTLVVLFFMQLKYDNPLNAMVFVFTILTVAFFLGFTAIDVGNRDTIDRFKRHAIYEGGNASMGGNIDVRDLQVGESMVDRARRLRGGDAAHGAVAAAVPADDHPVTTGGHAVHAHGEHEGHGPHAGHGHGNPELMGTITEAGYRRPIPDRGSSPDRSRPIRGVTLPGFAPAEPAHHGEGHGDHGSQPGQPEHGETPAAPAQPAGGH